MYLRPRYFYDEPHLETDAPILGANSWIESCRRNYFRSGLHQAAFAESPAAVALPRVVNRCFAWDRLHGQPHQAAHRTPAIFY